MVFKSDSERGADDGALRLTTKLHNSTCDSHLSTKSAVPEGRA